MIGAVETSKETQGKTVFESTSKRPLDKRKRNKNDDPSDIEGFLGPVSYTQLDVYKRQLYRNYVR